ncbi:MAG TPA: methyltransferase domain-containing protein [Bacteroidia bacterium]|jgi:SAM-dependent methyltransferase|nr:methyltransferase domain-containing protein [Bacteroidia bacterium]
MKSEWFENWFDSKYYHILYGNRDAAEAERFMNNLLSFLQLPAGARVHDLCCGKGRHSLFLNSKGFEVTGTDLSQESISYARQFENESLSFFVSDMRQIIRINYFDCVFNLFTSFGYFHSAKEDEEVVQAVHASLKKGGLFVLDYLNSEKACKMHMGEHKKEADGIAFSIRKHLDQGYFVKDITFSDEGRNYCFQERVRAFSKADFETLFRKAGFQIRHCLGDYNMTEYDEHTSDRLILIATKS